MVFVVSIEICFWFCICLFVYDFLNRIWADLTKAKSHPVAVHLSLNRILDEEIVINSFPSNLLSESESIPAQTKPKRHRRAVNQLRGRNGRSK